MKCSFSSPGDRQRSTSEREMSERLQSIQRRDTLILSQGTKTYFAPAQAAGLAALRDAHPDARILAGGTDVGLWVTKQHKDLNAVLYPPNIPQPTPLPLSDPPLQSSPP